MSELDAEQARWEELREPGFEPAAPDGFTPVADEDGGFEEVPGDG